MHELHPVDNKVVSIAKARLANRKAVSQTFRSEDDQYQVPVFRSLVKQLKDFCQTQHGVALLLGPKGSGKTKLLKLFQGCHTNCHFVDHSNGRVNQLISLNGATEIHSFEQVIAQFKNPEEGVVLLIDNADLLSLEQFKAVMVALTTHVEPALKIILAGEEILARRVMKHIEKESQNIPYTAIPLMPLSFQEMKEYVKQTFKHSKKDRKILSSKNLERIYELSQGYPGRVNNVATQLLAEITGKSVKPTLRRPRLWYIDVFILASIIMLLCGIGLQVIQQLHLLPKRTGHSVAASVSRADLARFILPPPSNGAVPVEELASPSYIPSIEGLPEELPEANGVVDLPTPPLLTP